MTKRTSRRVAVQWMAVLAAASFVVGCAQPASLSPTGVPSTSARATSLPTVGVSISSTPIPSAAPTDTPITSVIPTDTPAITAKITDVPTARPTSDAQLASKIDSFLAGLAAQDRFSGSVLVAKDGQVVLSKGYNLADREHALPNTPQTAFRIGSLTKQFTAMAILQLQQVGKLDVQDPICDYLQDCPDAWRPITIHHLLTHTSGIPELTALPTFPDFKKRPATPAETIDQFRELPLDFTPGEAWSYSNSGYIVLGAIVEAASGEPYCNFIDRHITQPLQMANTGCESTRPDIDGLAQGYSDSNTIADFIDMSVPLSGGGLVSTVEDLYLWDQALYTTTLLSQPLLDLLFTPMAPIPANTGTQDGYGYGWIIGDQLNRRRLWHRGGIEGFVSEIDRYPERRDTIIVLANREDVSLPDISAQIAQMIFENE